MKARVTFGTMVAMAALTVGPFGSGVASAGNFCVKACKAKKAAGMKECIQLGTGCGSIHRACRTTCREQYFGDDRKACYDECDRGKEECKQYRDACKDDCSIDFLECKPRKAAWTSLGSLACAQAHMTDAKAFAGAPRAVACPGLRHQSRHRLGGPDHDRPPEEARPVERPLADDDSARPSRAIMMFRRLAG